jgi:glycosyltransferase involved in cell wall biosynthesis
LLRFYRIARVTLAPTPSLVRWLEDAVGRPAFLMPRGVDCEQFHPRQRSVNDGVLRLGYVGRVTPEKRVRFLVDIERAMVAAGHTNFSIVVVGDGNERSWLEQNLRHGVFTGVLRGQFLGEAYANGLIRISIADGHLRQRGTGSRRFRCACDCHHARRSPMPHRPRSDGIRRAK